MKALGFAVGAVAMTAMMAAPQQAQAGTRVGIEVFLGFGHRQGDGAYRAGYERGYREGSEHGFRDADNRRDFDFDHDNAYRCADAGYRGYYGPKGYYQSGFRGGYESAYREAYASRFRERDRYYGRDHGRHDRERLDRRYDDHRDRERLDRRDNDHRDRDRDWNER
jgi:hypothetical protein